MKIKRRWILLSVVACLGYVIVGCGGSGAGPLEEGLDNDQNVVEDLCTTDVDYFEMFDCPYHDIIFDSNADQDGTHFSYESGVLFLREAGLDGDTVREIMICLGINECLREEYDLREEGCISQETMLTYSDECGLTDALEGVQTSQDDKERNEGDRENSRDSVYDDSDDNDNDNDPDDGAGEKQLTDACISITDAKVCNGSYMDFLVALGSPPLSIDCDWYVDDDKCDTRGEPYPSPPQD